MPFLRQAPRRLLLAAVLLAGTASCDVRPVRYAYRPTPVSGWEPKDTLSFPIDTIAHAGRYVLSVGVRTTARFPFQSLWLVVKQQWRRPARERLDTVVCRFTNAAGDPVSRGLSLNQYEFTVDTVSLGPGSCGHVSVRHIMRREILPGVSDVGVILREAR